jgi:hypothetical protein
VVIALEGIFFLKIIVGHMLGTGYIDSLFAEDIGQR